MAYKINALEQRIEKATTNQAIQFVYDEQGHLIGEYDAVTGNPQIEHVWLNDWPVAAIKDSQVFHVYPNHLGTPRAIADTQNNVVWYWNYDEPFGKTELNDEVSGTQFTYNLRFPGQYYDEETGLHYNWHRDYDAGTGRYIQSDPIGLQGGINTYSYVLNNAVNYVDSEGLATYLCSRPLNPLPFEAGPLRHEYICIDEFCRGLRPLDENPWRAFDTPGRISPEFYDPSGCEEKVGDNKCVERCIWERVVGPAPNYSINLSAGENCQTYARGIILECTLNCKGK